MLYSEQSKESGSYILLGTNDRNALWLSDSTARKDKRYLITIELEIIYLGWITAEMVGNDEKQGVIP